MTAIAPARFAEIEAAFNRYSVLVFPGQILSDAQQIAFSELFGPQEPVANYTGVQKFRLQGPISDLSNLDPRGKIWTEESERRLFNRCTMHRGLPYDDLKYRRDMHRTTVADRANTLEMSDA